MGPTSKGKGTGKEKKGRDREREGREEREGGRKRKGRRIEGLGICPPVSTPGSASLYLTRIATHPHAHCHEFFPHWHAKLRRGVNRLSC